MKTLLYVLLLSMLTMCGPSPGSMNRSSAQSAPILYYQFDGGTALAPTVGTGNLVPNGTYFVTSGGPVGKYLDLNSINSGYTTGGSVTTTNGFSMQLLFKAGSNYAKVRNGRILDNAHVSIGYEYPYLNFRTTLSGGTEQTHAINMNQAGIKSWDYLFDGDWHHLAFTHNTSTGVMRIYIDGQSPAPFIKNGTSGTLGAGGQISFSWGVPYVKAHCYLDEIAIYNTAIPDSQIYRGYQDYLNEDHYTNAYLTFPTSTVIPTTLDSLEFENNTVLPTVTATTVCNGKTPLEQLQNFPLPRYSKRTKTSRLFNWVDITYLAGRGTLGENSTSVAAAVALNKELGLRWNYYMVASESYADNASDYNNVSGNFSGGLAKSCNDNPTIPCQAITFRLSMNGNTPQISNKNLSADHYLKDGSGNFINIDGDVVTGSSKIWSPAAPLSTYTADGDLMKTYLTALLNALPNRPANKKLDIINENGEDFPIITPGALAKDSRVTSGAAEYGNDRQRYMAEKFSENTRVAYRDRFKSLPGLLNTKFTYYNLVGRVKANGESEFAMQWKYSRNVNSVMYKNQYLSTPDIYVRWPYNWKNWTSAWHGLRWLQESRSTEIAVGDSLFSPFVSAGWDNVEENNVRPAQWLGLLKAMSMYGADFFYTGFFNLSSPFPDPKNWTWQLAMPAYAQAIKSRMVYYIEQGHLMQGDVPIAYADDARPTYFFYTGHYHKLVMVRKANVGNSYAIFGTIMPQSNYAGSTPLTDTVTITLEGQPLTFPISRQGSTYIYNKEGNSPVFYQLDGWHEASHPSRWSTDFRMEAEVYDNYGNERLIKTATTTENQNGDYRSFTSYAKMLTPSAGLVYYFTPRQAASTQYVHIRARKVGTANQKMNVNINGMNNQKINVTSTDWAWYTTNVNSSRLAYTGVGANVEAKLRLYGNTQIEVDKIYITSNISATP